ncbi:MAG: hypothetical protein AAGA60_14365 [Cyanobacteria bacterium P01_E01_bin.42]
MLHFLKRSLRIMASLRSGLHSPVIYTFLPIVPTAASGSRETQLIFP